MIKNFKSFGQQGTNLRVQIDGKDTGTIDVLQPGVNPTVGVENNKLSFCLRVQPIPTLEEFLEMVSGGYLTLQDGTTLGLNP